MIGLNITVDVYRPTLGVTHDEPTATRPETATHTSAAARFTGAPRKEGAQLVVEVDGEQKVVTNIVLFDGDADVQVRDELLYSGSYYRVGAVKDIDKLGHHLEAWVVHVEGVT